jgi:hypothetical protein
MCILVDPMFSFNTMNLSFSENAGTKVVRPQVRKDTKS